tara:strand:- start:66 stop:443 length:378 start_codon:yes stop_codon:yes gene_type:complete
LTIALPTKLITGAVVSTTDTDKVPVVVALPEPSVAVIAKLCDVADPAFAAESKVTAPELLIDTPDPETDQDTVSFDETEPSAVAPSLTELTILLVMVGAVVSTTDTDKTELAALPTLSVAVMVKL